MKNEAAGIAESVNSISASSWINTLSALAVFGVIAIDVFQAAGFTTAVPNVSWTRVFISTAVSWSIPVLVMVYGALTLNKGPALQKRAFSFPGDEVAGIFISLVFWTVAYLVFIAFQQGHVNYKDAFVSILLGRTYYHIWYIYVLAGLLLFSPYIKACIGSCGEKESIILCVAVFLIVSITMLINYIVFKSSDEVTQTIFTRFIPYIAYFICGYQISVMNNEKTPYTILIILFIACFALAFYGAGSITNRYGMNMGMIFYSKFSPPVIGMSLTLFILFQKMFASRESNLVSNLGIAIGPATLGIYLLHPLVIDYAKMVFKSSSFHIRPLISLPIYTIATFALCWFIVTVIRKIPLLKRIV